MVIEETEVLSSSKSRLKRSAPLVMARPHSIHAVPRVDVLPAPLAITGYLRPFGVGLQLMGEVPCLPLLPHLSSATLEKVSDRKLTSPSCTEATEQASHESFEALEVGPYRCMAFRRLPHRPLPCGAEVEANPIPPTLSLIIASGTFGLKARSYRRSPPSSSELLLMSARAATWKTMS